MLAKGDAQGGIWFEMAKTSMRSREGCIGEPLVGGMGSWMQGFVWGVGGSCK